MNHVSFFQRFIKAELVESLTVTTKEHFAWSNSFTSYLIRIEVNIFLTAAVLEEEENFYTFCRRLKEFCE